MGEHLYSIIISRAASIQLAALPRTSAMSDNRQKGEESPQYPIENAMAYGVYRCIKYSRVIPQKKVMPRHQTSADSPYLIINIQMVGLSQG